MRPPRGRSGREGRVASPFHNACPTDDSLNGPGAQAPGLTYASDLGRGAREDPTRALSVRRGTGIGRG